MVGRAPPPLMLESHWGIRLGVTADVGLLSCPPGNPQLMLACLAVPQGIPNQDRINPMYWGAGDSTANSWIPLVLSPNVTPA